MDFCSCYYFRWIIPFRTPPQIAPALRGEFNYTGQRGLLDRGVLECGTAGNGAKAPLPRIPQLLFDFFAVEKGGVLLSHFFEVFTSALAFPYVHPAVMAFSFLLGFALFLPAVIYRRAFVTETSFLSVLRENRSIRIPEILFLLLGGALSALAATKHGLSLAGLTVILLLAVLGAIALVDGALCIIPDRFSVALLVLALLSIVTLRAPTGDTALLWYERLIGALSVALPMFILALIIPDAFGGGDIKMMAAVGILLGWRLTVLSTLFAILLGGSYGIYVLLRREKGRSDVFAFGPFLCIGIVLALLLGDGFLAFGDFLYEEYFAFPL